MKGMLMQEKRVQTVIRIALVVLGAALAVGALTFAGPCVHDDGTHSVCTTAGYAIRAAGLIVCGLSLGLGFVANSGRGLSARRIVALLIVACGVLAAFAPGSALLPTCMMATMRCNAVMVPFARVLGCLIAAAGLADVVLSARS